MSCPRWHTRRSWRTVWRLLHRQLRLCIYLMYLLWLGCLALNCCDSFMIRSTDKIQIIYAERYLAARTFRHAEAITVGNKRYPVNIVHRLWACQCSHRLGAVLFL